MFTKILNPQIQINKSASKVKKKSIRNSFEEKRPTQD